MNSGLQLLKEEGNRFGYRFSDEDFYLFLTAHEYKHYSWGGTGLRSLMDVYVYLKNLEGRLDWNYIKEEIRPASIILRSTAPSPTKCFCPM